jgi:hypothetical protein
VYIPNLDYGELFESPIKFTAPTSTGNYEINTDEGKLKINIEEPVLSLTNVKIEPSTIQPRETTKLSYTIENVGEQTLYNVNGEIKIILGAEDNYEFDSAQEELFTTMGPGEQRTVVKEIAARENAKGQERIGVEINYEFNGEKHYARDDTLLSVGGVPWFDIIIILVLVLAVGRVVLARYV